MCRKASPVEIDHYENILYPFQNEVFELIRTNKFYLSGGTCLSRFYYHHRYSDDLDFFFDGYLYSKDEFEIVFREIINRISEAYQTNISVDGEYFKRGFLVKNNIELKIEFIYENFKNVGQRQQEKNMLIDSKENIATNKLTAIYDRKTSKDFIDLYYLLKDVDFDQVAKWAEYKIVPLDYEGTLLAMANQNLEGTVLMKGEFSEIDFNNFQIELIDKMMKYARKS